jgi:hypothetical protein
LSAGSCGGRRFLAILSGTLFPAVAEQAFQRTYQASAYVTLFSVPILSRFDVG